MSSSSLVGLPTIFGPCLVFFLSLCIRILNSVQESEETEIDTSDIPGQQRVVYLVSLLTSVTGSIKILVAETIFGDVETENVYLMGLMVMNKQTKSNYQFT